MSSDLLHWAAGLIHDVSEKRTTFIFKGQWIQKTKEACSFKTMLNNYPGTQRDNSDMDIQNRYEHGPEPFNTNQQSLVQKNPRIL
jgi:hypothetical protein